MLSRSDKPFLFLNLWHHVSKLLHVLKIHVADVSQDTL